MARESVVEQIRSLDPVSDYQRIVFLIKCSDFALDTTHALALALFRTYCVRSISRPLDRTGELRDRPQKRYDDADLIVSELRAWGYASDRGRAAPWRMNRTHGRFANSNEDSLHVLTIAASTRRIGSLSKTRFALARVGVIDEWH